MTGTLTLGVLFGGPSPERSISLASARSLCDHLPRSVRVRLIYLGPDCHPYRTDRRTLYQNTAEDFSFRLTAAERYADWHHATDGCDLLFPCGHGFPFETGDLASWLGEADIPPLLGATAEASRHAFDKRTASQRLEPEFAADWQRTGTTTDAIASAIESIDELLTRCPSVIVKPRLGGSSMGVHLVRNAKEFTAAITQLQRDGFDAWVAEPNERERFPNAREFTVVLLQNDRGEPIALPPVMIDCDGPFTTRRKYLPTNEVRITCPPERDAGTIANIRGRATEAFRTLGLRDIARVDGWLREDGSVRLSDVNVIPGLEQTGLVFLSAATVGLTHREFLAVLLRFACERRGIVLPPEHERAPVPVRTVRVLLGGSTSERQVSVQSGTNVRLKLESTGRVRATPFLLTRAFPEDALEVWELPADVALLRTVEEMLHHCRRDDHWPAEAEALRRQIRSELHLENEEGVRRPRRLSWSDFLLETNHERQPVFNALHGGFGENGSVQRELTAYRIPFNGSGAATSAVCIDKATTYRIVESFAIEGLVIPPHRVFHLHSLDALDLETATEWWRSCQERFCGSPAGNRPLILKPTSDGCSSGIVRLTSAEELQTVIEALLQIANRSDPKQLSPSTFDPVTLPSTRPERVLLESFLETCRIAVGETGPELLSESPWVEVTIGVLESYGQLRVLTPTLTVRGGDILSIEEKFQSGTGINLTPPPPEIVPPDILRTAGFVVQQLAERLAIRGYARVDGFLHREEGTFRLLEVNTLPGLTPATALFHQALAESPPLFPADLLLSFLPEA